MAEVATRVDTTSGAPVVGVAVGGTVASVASIPASVLDCPTKAEEAPLSPVSCILEDGSRDALSLSVVDLPPSAADVPRTSPAWAGDSSGDSPAECGAASSAWGLPVTAPLVLRREGGHTKCGGLLCELAVKDAIEEYFRYHGFEESLAALRTEAECIHWRLCAALSRASSDVGATPAGDNKVGGNGGEAALVNAAVDCSRAMSATAASGGELVVARALADFESGRRDELFKVWNWLVPEADARSPTGCALELRLHVHFGVLDVRRALNTRIAAAQAKAQAAHAPIGSPAAAEGESGDKKSAPGGVADALAGLDLSDLGVEPDFEDLKAFLAAHPATALDESSETLAPLFALPFVPQPYTRPGLKFLFEESWVNKLRADLCTFLMAHATARHAPALKHLAGSVVVARGPKASPPPASWHELVRIADQGLAAASRARSGVAHNPGGRSRPGEWTMNLELLSEIMLARRRLAAIAANPDIPPPAPVVSAPAGHPGSAASLPVDPEASPPVCGARLWPMSQQSDLRAGSAMGVPRPIYSRSPSSPKRLCSARSIESRARTATALLPVPPGLDFGRIAAVLAGDEAPPAAQGDTPAAVSEAGEEDWIPPSPPPPLQLILRAVLRRLALPDEPIRPRRAFLAAFACFGCLRTLAGRLDTIVTGSDAELTELAFAVLAVCACEAVGRREIEAAELAKQPNSGCIASLVTVLKRDPPASPAHMQCLAVLQRLSLRKTLQVKMIELGVIEWILQMLAATKSEASGGFDSMGPSGGFNAPDFSAEFSSALLMNLTLRSAGRQRCGEAGGVDILTSLIEHPNPQVRTHVNGTLYTLLAVPSWRAVAATNGTEAALQAALARAPATPDDPLRRQLEYLLFQLGRTGGVPESGDGEESEDGEVEEGADDGDNFLDEEELAAFFLLASASAADDLAMMHAEEEAKAAAAAAAAEAAAAEEVLRPFRVSPAVADLQQRRFHAFIARNCRGLISPKRRGSGLSGCGPDALLGAVSPGNLGLGSSPLWSAPSPNRGRGGSALGLPRRQTSFASFGDPDPSQMLISPSLRSVSSTDLPRCASKGTADASPKSASILAAEFEVNSSTSAPEPEAKQSAAADNAEPIEDVPAAKDQPQRRDLNLIGPQLPQPPQPPPGTTTDSPQHSPSHGQTPVTKQTSDKSQTPAQPKSGKRAGNGAPSARSGPGGGGRGPKPGAGGAERRGSTPDAQAASVPPCASRGQKPEPSSAAAQKDPTKSARRRTRSEAPPQRRKSIGGTPAQAGRGENGDRAAGGVDADLYSARSGASSEGKLSALSKAEAAAAMIETAVSTGASSQFDRWRQPKSERHSQKSNGTTSNAGEKSAPGGAGRVGAGVNGAAGALASKGAMGGGGASSLAQLPRITQRR